MNNNNNNSNSESSSDNSSSVSSFELKAGMQGVDKEAVAKIIDDLTRGTPFYEHQKKKEAEREKKAQKLLEKSASFTTLTKEAQAELKASVDEEVALILKHAKIGRYCHIDMDAFHASVEELDKPHLKQVPMAVGSNAIIGTSNYPARRFGCRGGQPGFVARHLCPQLVIVPPNFEKYQAKTDQIRQVAKTFDKNFIAPFGGDELFIELSDANIEAWKKRKRRDPDFNQKELLPSSSNNNTDNENDNNNNKKKKKANKASSPVEDRVIDEFLFVQDLRQEIFNATQLTCSAGIGPTRTLAKIVSNFNKPNGQFALEARTIEEIKEYVWANFKTRQIPGIGPATDSLLQKLGILTCRELFETRTRLKFLMPPKTFSFLLQASLGLTGTVPNEDLVLRTSSSSKKKRNEHQQQNDSSKSLLPPAENDKDLAVKQVSIERTLERRVTTEHDAEEVLNFLLNRSIVRLKESVRKYVAVSPVHQSSSASLFTVTIKNVGVSSRLRTFEDKLGTRKISENDFPEDDCFRQNILVFDRNGLVSTKGPAKRINDTMTRVLKEKIFELSSGGKESNNSNNNNKPSNSFLSVKNCDQYRLMGCRISYLWPPVPASPECEAALLGEINDNGEDLSLLNDKTSSSTTTSSASLFDDDEMGHDVTSDLADVVSGSSLLKSVENSSSSASSPPLDDITTKNKTLIVVQGQEMRSFVERGLEALSKEEAEAYEIFEFATPQSTPSDNIFMTSTNELTELVKKYSSNGNNSNVKQFSVSSSSTASSLAALIDKIGARPKAEYSNANTITAQERMKDLNFKSVMLCGSVSNKESASTFQAMIIGSLSLLVPSLLELRELDTENDGDRQRKFLEIVARKSAGASSAESSSLGQPGSPSSTSTGTKSHLKSFIQLFEPHSCADEHSRTGAGNEDQENKTTSEENDEQVKEPKILSTSSSTTSRQLIIDNETQQQKNGNLNSTSLLQSLPPSPRECFLNLHRHIISFNSPLREADRAALRNSIHSFNERQRKQWLMGSTVTRTNISKQYSSSSPAGYILMRSYKNFVNSDVKTAALGECQDLIPHAVDGLTRPQRHIIKVLLLLEMNQSSSTSTSNSNGNMMNSDSFTLSSSSSSNSTSLPPLSLTMDEIVSLALELDDHSGNTESMSTMASNTYHDQSQTPMPMMMIKFTPNQLSRAVFELTELNPHANLPLLLMSPDATTSSMMAMVGEQSNKLHKKDISFTISPILRTLFPREDDELLRTSILAPDSATILANASSVYSPLLLAPIVPLILINNNEVINQLVNSRSSTSSFAGNFTSQIPRFHPIDVANRTATYLRYVLRRKGGQITDGGGGDRNEVKKVWYRGVDADPFLRSTAQDHTRILSSNFSSSGGDVVANPLNSAAAAGSHKRSFHPPFVCIDKSSKKVGVLSEVDDFFRIHHRARQNYYKRRMHLRREKLEQEINMEENVYRFCSAVGRGTLKFTSLQGDRGFVDFFEKFGYERFVPAEDTAAGTQYKKLIVNSASSKAGKRRLSSSKSRFSSFKNNKTNNINARTRGYEYLLTLPPSSFTEDSLKDSWDRIQKMRDLHRDLCNDQIDTNSLFKTDIEVFATSVTLHMREEFEKQKTRVDKARERQRVLFPAAKVDESDESSASALEDGEQHQTTSTSNDEKSASKKEAIKKSSSSAEDIKNNGNNTFSLLKRAEIAERIRRENEELFKLNNQNFYDSIVKKKLGINGKNGCEDENGEFSDLPDEDCSFREQKKQFMKSMSKDDRRRALSRHDDGEYEYDEFDSNDNNNNSNNGDDQNNNDSAYSGTQDAASLEGGEQGRGIVSRDDEFEEDPLPEKKSSNKKSTSKLESFSSRRSKSSSSSASSTSTSMRKSSSAEVFIATHNSTGSGTENATISFSSLLLDNFVSLEMKLTDFSTTPTTMMMMLSASSSFNNNTTHRQMMKLFSMNKRSFGSFLTKKMIGFGTGVKLLF